jgi:hypothetical protein
MSFKTRHDKQIHAIFKATPPPGYYQSTNGGQTASMARASSVKALTKDFLHDEEFYMPLFFFLGKLETEDLQGILYHVLKTFVASKSGTLAIEASLGVLDSVRPRELYRHFAFCVIFWNEEEFVPRETREMFENLTSREGLAELVEDKLASEHPEIPRYRFNHDDDRHVPIVVCILRHVCKLYNLRFLRDDRYRRIEYSEVVRKVPSLDVVVMHLKCILWVFYQGKLQRDKFELLGLNEQEERDASEGFRMVAKGIYYTDC